MQFLRHRNPIVLLTPIIYDNLLSPAVARSTTKSTVSGSRYSPIAVGLAAIVWPGIRSHGDDVPHMNTAVRSLLGAVSLLSLVGIRYPLKMLPILFFEIVWKAIWILSFGLPLWRKRLLTGDFAETMFNCLAMVIILPFIPWDYVYRNYIKAPSDPLGHQK